MANKRTPNRQYIYYFLASCACVSILFSIIYSHINSENLQAVLSKKTKSIKIHSTLSKLSDAVGKLNAPGNDIFLSKNIPAEIAAYKSAEENFHKLMQELESEISKDSNFKDSVSQEISQISKHHKNVNIFISEIFSLYNQMNPKQAASTMAKMDREFQKLSS
jgi:hypothetical protein